MDEPGWTGGKINSPKPDLGPEPNHLISFAILWSDTANVFNDPDKWTILSWVAWASKWFCVSLKSILVFFDISCATKCPKSLWVLIPVPTAVPPCAN